MTSPPAQGFYHLEEGLWIDVDRVDFHPPMQMGPGGAARGPGQADGSSLFDPLAHLHVDPAQMGIGREHPGTVVDDDGVAGVETAPWSAAPPRHRPHGWGPRSVPPKSIPV